ncbi:MAG: CapA family protein [Anaerolineaceae bacterium]|nr:CapA family protein [Anaerolineaceae bacterium]
MPRAILRSLFSASLLLLLCVRPAERTITLALLGDIMLGRGIAAVHQAGDWESALAALAPTLQQADLSLANLESPLGKDAQSANTGARDASGYNLCAPPESVSALTAAGLDLLSLANNHNLDCGLMGLQQTSDTLASAGLTSILPGSQAVYRTVNGLKLAFFAFDDVTAPLDMNAAAAAIRKARAGGALVIVSIHCGAEYHPSASHRQRTLAQEIADAGAALIWGHHPHVLQPLEWVQRGGHDGPSFVAYSLGNALFDQFSPPDARRSALLLVTLDAQGVLSANPLPIHIDPLTGRSLPADAETAQAVLHRLGNAARQVIRHPWNDH